MRGLEDIPSHTPVLARKQWLQNAFKPTEKHRAPAPGHDLVHSRLSWLEEQKRKSRATMSPNNKDASNIPEHLVEDRKKWLDDELRQMLKQTEGHRRHSFPTRRFTGMVDSSSHSDFGLTQSYSYDMHDKVASEYVVGRNYSMPCSTTSTDTSDMTGSNYSSSYHEFRGVPRDGGDVSMDETVPLYFDNTTSNDLQRYMTQENEELDYKIVNIGHVGGQKQNATSHITVRKHISVRGDLQDLVSPTSCLADYARHSAHTFSRTQLGVGFPDEELVPQSAFGPMQTPPRKKQVPPEKASKGRDTKAAARSTRRVQPREAGCNCTIM